MAGRRLSKGIALLSVAATLVCASTAAAQSSDGRRRGRVGGSPAIGPIAAAVEARGRTLATAQGPADSVADGVGIGALTGAAAALGLMGYFYSKCRDTCDAPEPLPMYLSAAATSTGVGAVIGWIADAAHRSSTQRVVLGGAVTRRRADVRF